MFGNFIYVGENKSHPINKLSTASSGSTDRLLSSRPKQDIVESSKDAPPQRPSISSQSGFTSDLILEKFAPFCNAMKRMTEREDDMANCIFD